MSFLGWRGVLNRDYKKWMLQQTDDLVNAVDRYAREQSGRPIIHLNSWQADKEKLARKRQEQAGIKSGLIGAWSCLESCWSYRANYCADKGYPQLHRYTTQCKHLYLEALAEPPSSVLQAQYSEARSQHSESEPFHEQRLIHILTPEFCYYRKIRLDSF